MGLWSSSKSSLRLATILSLVTIYFCAFSERENVYERAYSELDQLISLEPWLYSQKIDLAFKDACPLAPADSIFLKLAEKHNFKLKGNFPEHFKSGSRNGNSIRAPYFGDWISYDEPLLEFLISIRNYHQRATFQIPDLNQFSSSLDRLFSYFENGNPTLVAYLLNAVPGQGKRFEIDVDLDFGGKEVSEFVNNGQKVWQISETPHQGKFRYKYGVSLQAEEVTYFPSFSSFMVDSVGLGEITPTGVYKIPSLESLANEVGDMKGREALRHLIKKVSEGDQKGDLFSISFSYKNSSWLPLLVILILQLYSWIHLREYCLVGGGSTQEIQGTWIIVCEGILPGLLRWAYLCLPVIAGVISVFCWPNSRLQNILISGLTALLAVLLHAWVKKVRLSIQEAEEITIGE